MPQTVHPTATAEIKSAEVAEHFRDLINMLDRVSSGYGITTTTNSLNADIATGKAYIKGKKVGLDTNTTDTQVTLTASTTNRVYLKQDGTFEVRVPAQSGDPANSFKLYTVVTSATGVAVPSTDITDHRDNFAVRIDVEFFADAFRGQIAAAYLEVFKALITGAEPFIEFTDSGTGDVTRIWARNNKLQVTNASGSTVYIDDLAALSLSALSGTISDAQHGSRGGGTLHANATTGAAGFMSPTDKTKLDDATSAATASKLMIRDASGRAQVAAPSAAADIARKDTVDTVQTNLTNHKAAGGSEHPAATTGAAGFMSAADKTKLDDATAAATASKLVSRDADIISDFATLQTFGEGEVLLVPVGYDKVIAYAGSQGSDADGAWDTGQVTSEIFRDGSNVTKVTILWRYDSGNGYRLNKKKITAGGRTRTITFTYDGSGRCTGYSDVV